MGANVIAITIPPQMGHSLVTVKNQERNLFDIGNITEKEERGVILHDFSLELFGKLGCNLVSILIDFVPVGIKTSK